VTDLFLRRVLRAAAAVLALVLVAMVGPVSAAGAAPHEPVQVDCGTITCTVRFDRAATQRQAEGNYSADILEAAVCGPLTLAAAVPGVACVAMVKGLDIAMQEYGKTVYARGDCTGVRIVPLPVGTPVPVPVGVILPAPVPISVKGGTFNCV
jgi:hypothetical protein